jgi:predicted phage replisome organizer
MRKQEHGKEMQIVYLRMMLLSLDKGGYIYYQGVYSSLEEELAEEFDEPMEIIRETLDYLMKNHLITIDENSNCFIPESLKLTGSESDGAERVRKHRAKQKTLHCNADVTECNEAVTTCNVEIDIDKDIEKEIDTELEKEIEKSRDNVTVSKDTVRQTDVRRIVDEWNTLSAFGISQISSISSSSKRYKLLNARIREHGIEEVVRAIHNVSESTFLKGGNKSGWIITFDWFVRPNNFIKVLEGNYTDRDCQGMSRLDEVDRWK